MDPSGFHNLGLNFHNTLVEALELPRIAAIIEVSRVTLIELVAFSLRRVGICLPLLNIVRCSMPLRLVTLR